MNDNRMGPEGRPILIIDDDEELQEALVELLTELGFKAEAVANGQLALERLNSMPDVPLLIILDLKMPVMDGCEFRAEQRRQPALSSIPVVLVTADRDVEEHAAALGVDGYLRKPVAVRDLAPLVRRYCSDPALRSV